MCLFDFIPPKMLSRYNMYKKLKCIQLNCITENRSLQYGTVKRVSFIYKCNKYIIKEIIMLLIIKFMK